MVEGGQDPYTPRTPRSGNMWWRDDRVLYSLFVMYKDLLALRTWGEHVTVGRTHLPESDTGCYYCQQTLRSHCERYNVLSESVIIFGILAALDLKVWCSVGAVVVPWATVAWWWWDARWGFMIARWSNVPASTVVIVIGREPGIGGWKDPDLQGIPSSG